MFFFISLLKYVKWTVTIEKLIYQQFSTVFKGSNLALIEKWHHVLNFDRSYKYVQQKSDNVKPQTWILVLHTFVQIRGPNFAGFLNSWLSHLPNKRGEKKNRTRYIEEGTADLLKLLNCSRLFHDYIYFDDKEVCKNLWIAVNKIHRRNLWFDVWVFFFDIEGKLWKSRGLWLRRLAEKGLQYSAQCPLILANSNSIAVVYKTQW